MTIGVPGRRRLVTTAATTLTTLATLGILGLLISVLATAATTPGIQTMTMPASVHTALLAAESDATVAVAVLDTDTGDYYGSTEADTPFPSESVVKVLIAANLLATGQMSASIEQQAYQMITTSDDADADALWSAAGGPGVVAWAESRYGISDLGAAPSQPGWWGNTKITAQGMVQFYAAIKADPVVGPWLTNAMSHMATTADDGTDQDFGLAAQSSVGAFKQGWGGDDDAFDSEQLNSTGLLDGDRFAVAVLVQHVPYEAMSDLLPVIDTVAAAIAPQGAVLAPQPSAPAVPPANPPSAGAPSTDTPSAGATGTGAAGTGSAGTGSAAPAAGTPTAGTSLAPSSPSTASPSTSSPSTASPSAATAVAGVGSATVIAGPRSAMTPVLARTAHALIAGGIAALGLTLIAAISMRRRRH